MEDSKLKDITKNFSETTSCHGLGQIYASESRAKRYFWILLVLAGFSVLTSQLIVRFLEYTRFDTTTAFSEKFVPELEFPAVTICNFNRYFNVTSTEERAAINTLSQALLGSENNISNVEYFDKHRDGSVKNYASEKGWELSNRTMWWCFYGVTPCTASDFIPRITTMGKCWTFNKSVVATRAGSQHGLTIAVDVQQELYSEELTGEWEAGLRALVHPKYEHPDVEERGLAIPIGTRAFIPIHLKQTSIMRKPWGDCEPDQESLEFYNTYTRKNCLQECFQSYTRAIFGCDCDLFIFETNGDLKECTSKQTVRCLVNASISSSNWTLRNCECQPACNQTEYQSTISYATLPSNHIAMLLSQNESEILRTKSNMVGLDVYFNSMSYTLQVEREAITVSALLSDLGGQLGLWMGISMVTLVEIVQYIISYCIEGRKYSKKEKDPVDLTIHNDMGGKEQTEDLPK